MPASSSCDNLLLAATLLQVTTFISRLAFVVPAGVSHVSIRNSAITAANSKSTLLVCYHLPVLRVYDVSYCDLGDTIPNCESAERATLAFTKI